MKVIRKFAFITMIVGAVLVSCGSGTTETPAEGEPAAGAGESAQQAEPEGGSAGTGVEDALQPDTPATDAARRQALSFQDAFREVARVVAPEVVEVNVVNVVNVERQQSPFDFFFGPDDDGGGDGRQYRRQGLGSGVIVRRDGRTTYAVTNAHVVSEVDEVSVVLHDDREFDAEIVGSDSRLDLALLSFEAPGDVPVATFGNSNALQVGDWVVAVGNPLGFQSTVTTGIVSALGRSAPQQGGAVSNITDFIQTDAAINPGNSGGALANLDGEIIGINTWIASRSGGSVGIGFAIPSNNVEKAVNDFIEEGQVVYGWLGVSIGDANPQLYPNIREDMGLGDTSGAMVFNVYSGSPADNDGILPGDFITSANGENVENANQLTRIVGNLSPGQSIDFGLVRYGSERRVSVDITQRRPESELEGQLSMIWPGMYVINLNDELRERLDIGRRRSGVVVRVAVEGSPAAQSGIRQGDLITEVNGRSVESMQDFYRELNERGSRSDDLTIVRRGETLERRITP
ncbi:MAG: Do family serine endopeptidase [Spirochaetes bacterium]|jgi:serine protease Do|nr:Do family serine endopeptidase [Spirochaetota bacterium]